MKKTLLFLPMTIIILVLTWAFAAEDLSHELNENIVRLHIIANSDREADQILKLRVRDALLHAAGTHPDRLTDAQIASVCDKEIAASGFAYPVHVFRGSFYFPRKSYENLTLPAGEYRAVRIVLGNGAGQNWWCVMYPPLCFTGDAYTSLNQEAMQALEGTLSPETIAAICESERITIKPSFKLLELWQSLKTKLS
ncbi:MAG: stage II sporulation protein R [Ruminococcaceae bacterium]|nr:stage II sporulation protein R [Oscillospiraceae bacterium]